MSVVLIVLLALFLGLLFLAAPAVRRHPDRRVIKGLYIAHRGLHDIDKGTPENSLAAFAAAVARGYAIENDIHVTADGAVVVFHDNNLKRMCGVDVNIEESTLSELRKYTLLGTNEHIPTLKECLDLVDGRVPLLIEFKSQSFENSRKLCEAADEILKDYNGKYFIQSFYPPVLLWYRKNREEIWRGQLSTAFKGEHISKRLLGFLLFNKSFRHIDFVKIRWIPCFTSRQHLVDSSENHTGNGDNGSFLTATLNKGFILLFVVRRFVRFYGCMITLY